MIGMSFRAALFQSALLSLYVVFTAVAVLGGPPFDAPLWAVFLLGLVTGPVLVTVWFGWLDRKAATGRN
jgi:hypothetical protein